jgi:two-component system sensor histidine kinase KdpD
MELLNADIDVVSTMNVQHIESVTPIVGRITGVVVRETVPDWVLQRVDEIVLSDLTPEALQARMKRGDIYPLERSDRALSNFFRPGNLIALRELALRQVGNVVDRSLESYRDKEHIESRTPITERIAVCVSSNPAAQYLVARTARMAERIGAEFFVLYVDIGRDDDPENRRTLDENFRFAENLGAQIVKVKGKKVAAEVAKIVREKHITQIVFGRSAQTGWRRFLYFSAIHDFLRDAPLVDVHIVTQEAK